MTTEIAYWIALSAVRGIGPARFATLLDYFGSAEAAWGAQPTELVRANLDKRTLESLLATRQSLKPDQLWSQVERSGVTCVTWTDPRYPQWLQEIGSAPPVLYVDGTLTPVDSPAVAIVGTRRASAYGREVAYRLATELARNSVTVVSGLALGIDAIAHQAALDAGGRTFAVLGSGVDLVYPTQNRMLARTIRERGAVISEYPLGTRPEPANFPPRNRIISGLSQTVIIVEAGVRSGALITATFAAEQGRDVFAVPGSILHPGSEGCNRLIQDGAAPLMSVDDVLDQLDLSQRRRQDAVRQAVPPDPAEADLLTHLGQAPLHIDELVRRAAMNPAEVNSLLAIMELKGLVRQVGNRQYVLG